jgi:peptide/nickel transport system permease protein
VVETGPVRAIFHDAQHPYTRQLLDGILEDTTPRGPLVTAGTPTELKGVTS